MLMDFWRNRVSTATLVLALGAGPGASSQAFAAPIVSATQPPSAAALRTAPNPSATAHVIGQPDVIYVTIVPRRPQTAGELHVAIGTFISFQLASAPAEMILTMHDANGAPHEYVLGAHTTLNGKPLHCPTQSIVDGTALCAAFPSNIVPEKTRLAVLYWSESFSSFNVVGTDEIVAL